jgi:hypothetical protein
METNLKKAVLKLHDGILTVPRLRHRPLLTLCERMPFCQASAFGRRTLAGGRHFMLDDGPHTLGR